MNINPFEMLRAPSAEDVIKRARIVGKSAIIQWKDATDDKFHTEHLIRKAEEQAISETLVFRELAAHNGNPEDEIFYTEKLCSLFGESLCRSDELGNTPRALWARDNLVESLGQLPTGAGEHLFKPEQSEVISRYLDIQPE